jgi:putative restriction endonuclease
MPVADDLLHRLARLNVDRSTGQRKPHKPLLMLLAIQRWVVEGQRELAFAEIEQPLKHLLDLYAPPITGAQHAEYPFWYLQSDGVWELPQADRMARNAKGFPTMDAFRACAGRIPEPYASALAADPALAERAVQLLLDEHFEPSLHEDLRADLGLESMALLMESRAPVELARESAHSSYAQKRPRSASFREEVLAAYDHRCAVTGFQALMGKTLFCLEAAHVHWHSQGGRSSVDNGLALTPTLHKLFDHGAWTLDDRRCLLVSRHFSGSDGAIAELRGLHGKPLRDPVPGCAPLALDCIRWHRERHLGGVFRGPELGQNS